MNFKEMSLENLQIAHSEMCATAGDLKLKLKPVWTVDFDTVEGGVLACENIHAAIQLHQKKVAEGEGKEDTAMKEGTKKVPSVQDKMATQKAARLARDAAGGSAPAVKAPTKKAGAATTGEKVVAKKAKKAKKAKAAPAKKAGAARTKFPDDAKVTWVAKENPAREGSARFDRYEKLRKGSGKTVKALLASGVPSATIANAQSSKTVTVK